MADEYFAVPCSLVPQIVFMCFCLHSLVQLGDQLSVTCFLPTFNFLGSLLKAVPDVAHSLVTRYGETLQRTITLYITFRQGFLYKDEQHALCSHVYNFSVSVLAIAMSGGFIL